MDNIRFNENHEVDELAQVTDIVSFNVLRDSRGIVVQAAIHLDEAGDSHYTFQPAEWFRLTRHVLGAESTDQVADQLRAFFGSPESHHLALVSLLTKHGISFRSFWYPDQAFYEIGSLPDNS